MKKLNTKLTHSRTITSKNIIKRMSFSSFIFKLLIANKDLVPTKNPFKNPMN